MLSAERLNCDPAWLRLEIVETIAMGDEEKSGQALAQLKAIGVHLSIDDFGTGYSSLTALHRLPVDALKIDRSFIAAMKENREGASLIRTLVQLGKALSIETFAEGIERSQELDLLRAEDCDNGQGFLFARPLDAEAAGAYLREWSAAEHASGELTPPG